MGKSMGLLQATAQQTAPAHYAHSQSNWIDCSWLPLSEDLISASALPLEREDEAAHK